LTKIYQMDEQGKHDCSLNIQNCKAKKKKIKLKPLFLK